mmetsp:Transcript_1267/g.1313  ORF Transcript_1267/g.1313 Transcript_1267/m.1313 type:complete len:118 (+) Transcript_1267:1001-1354(+)
MYYRVAHSYLKGQSNSQSINVVGKNYQNQLTQEQLENGPAASYFKAPMKPRYVQQAAKIDQLKLRILNQQKKSIQRGEEVHPLLNSRPSIVQQSKMGYRGKYGSNQSIDSLMGKDSN